MFSVVISLYNKEKFISNAIVSVLRQSFSDFQLIVIDDGSTDAGFEMASAFSDPRIEIYQQKNMGNGPARNAGIAHSRNAWVAFLDADDVWYPDHLEELVRIGTLCPDAGLISTQICLSRCGYPVLDRKTDDDSVEYIDYFSVAKLNPHIVHSSSVAMNLDVLGDCAYFNSYSRGTDLECWARIAMRSRVAVSKKETSVYFLGTGGIVDNFSADGGVFASVPSGLDVVSPAVELAWNSLDTCDLHIRNSVFSYAKFYTNQYIRGSLYRGKFSNALKVSGFASQYSYYYVFLYYFLCLGGVSRLILSVFRACSRVLKYVRQSSI